jgi:hypothetical protein
MTLQIYPATIEVQQKELTLSQKAPGGEVSSIKISFEQIDSVCELLYRVKMAILEHQAAESGIKLRTDDASIANPGVGGTGMPGIPMSDMGGTGNVPPPSMNTEVMGTGGVGNVPAGASAEANPGNGGAGAIEPYSTPA